MLLLSILISIIFLLFYSFFSIKINKYDKSEKINVYSSKWFFFLIKYLGLHLIIWILIFSSLFFFKHNNYIPFILFFIWFIWFFFTYIKVWKFLFKKQYSIWNIEYYSYTLITDKNNIIKNIKELGLYYLISYILLIISYYLNISTTMIDTLLLAIPFIVIINWSDKTYWLINDIITIPLIWIIAYYYIHNNIWLEVLPFAYFILYIYILIFEIVLVKLLNTYLREKKYESLFWWADILVLFLLILLLWIKFWIIIILILSLWLVIERYIKKVIYNKDFKWKDFLFKYLIVWFYVYIFIDWLLKTSLFF